MPIYEYRCDNCGHELEQLQKVTDPLLVDCPACEQPTLRKQVSAAGFRLKGGGWYETDFKKAGDKRRNLHEGSDKVASAAKEDKGADKTLKDAA